MARTPKAALYRVRESFAIPGDGFMEPYPQGQLVGPDDPVVRSHGHLLEPAENALVGAATGAPVTVTLPQAQPLEVTTAHREGHAHKTTTEPYTKEGEATMPFRDSSIGPEDPRSPASTFAKDQPGAGVVAADVPDEQNPAGGPKADTGSAESAGAYDPGDYTVAQVNEHLDGADEAEKERILQAERDGQNRSGIVG